MAILSERTWRRHSNPLSGWSRLLSYPLAYVPLWNRSWKQGAAVAVWFALNPVLFPEPESDESWMTRGVLGEKLWTAERPRDLSVLLGAAAAPFAAGAFWSAYKRRFWPMVFCASTTLLLELWYVDRMVSYYEQHRDEVHDGAKGGQPGKSRDVPPETPRAVWFRTTASRLVPAVDR